MQETYFAVSHTSLGFLNPLPHNHGFLRPCVRSLWKQLLEKEKLLITLSLFPTMFSTRPKTNFNFSVTLFCHLEITFYLDQSKILSFGKELTLSQTISDFLLACGTSLLKMLCEKEKLLITSNFSSSHSVLYPLGKPSIIFIKFESVVCKPCQVGSI